MPQDVDTEFEDLISKAKISPKLADFYCLFSLRTVHFPIWRLWPVQVTAKTEPFLFSRLVCKKKYNILLKSCRKM